MENEALYELNKMRCLYEKEAQKNKELMAENDCLVRKAQVQEASLALSEQMKNLDINDKSELKESFERQSKKMEDVDLMAENERLVRKAQVQEARLAILEQQNQASKEEDREEEVGKKGTRAEKKKRKEGEIIKYMADERFWDACITIVLPKVVEYTKKRYTTFANEDQTKVDRYRKPNHPKCKKLIMFEAQR